MSALAEELARRQEERDRVTDWIARLEKYRHRIEELVRQAERKCCPEER